MSEIRKIILDIDSPTHTQTKKAIDRYQQDKKSGLIVPTELLQTCQGCGSNMYYKQKQKYFGQEFCSDCVDKWKSGAK